MKWEEYKDEFEFDGSWRDIYVLATSISDWQALLDFLRSGVFSYSYTKYGETTALPSDADELFEADAGLLLIINVGLVELNCHFFEKENIEFDFDPRDITSEDSAEQVFAFMRQLGSLLKKNVRLTLENSPEIILFEFFLETDQTRYNPMT